MSETSRQLFILQRLKLHLEGIRPENGYSFDLSNRVHLGRLQFGAGDELPHLSIVENPEQGDLLPADLHRTYTAYDWRLWVQGWVKNDTIADLYLLKASVEKRLAALTRQGDDYYLGRAPDERSPLLTGMLITPGIVRPADLQRGSNAFLYIPLVLRTVLDFTNLFVTADE